MHIHKCLDGKKEMRTSDIITASTTQCAVAERANNDREKKNERLSDSGVTWMGSGVQEGREVTPSAFCTALGGHHSLSSV